MSSTYSYIDINRLKSGRLKSGTTVISSGLKRRLELTKYIRYRMFKRITKANCEIEGTIANKI